jgi:hypothetical protein
MPMDVCGAESQGFIGYMLVQCLKILSLVRWDRRWMLPCGSLAGGASRSLAASTMSKLHWRVRPELECGPR